MAAALLAGCGGDGSSSTRTGTTSPAAPAPSFEVPPGCERAAPKTVVTAPVPGLVASTTPVIFEAVGKTGTATRAKGFIAMKPGQFVAEFRARKDVQLLFSENEGFEAEVLVAAGETQTFYKLTSACDGGSEVVAVVTERL